MGRVMLAGTIMRRLCLPVIMIMLLSVPARADLAGSLARFAADDFAETAVAIQEIAASGAPNAAAIIEALADRRLFVVPATKSVIYRNAAGKPVDAGTGNPMASESADPQLVRVNNRPRIDHC